MSDTTEINNWRGDPDGTKGTTDVSSETENKNGPLASLLSRRKLLAMAGAGAAVAATGAGVAAGVIKAGTDNPSPRSPNPVGLTPITGRNEGAIEAPPGGVRLLALAGTDGWATFPSVGLVGGANGVADIGAYFPDPLADMANRNTYVFSFRNVTGLDRQTVASQKGRTQICAPLFYSTVGEELWVTLTNLGLSLRPDLVDGHTLHWHGFRNAIPFYDGVPESSISVPIGRDFTYVYRPEDAGTYMFHCHFEDVEHVTMGMQGIVFVKPDPATIPTGTQQAYGPLDGDDNNDSYYDREYAILLGEIDTRAHFNDAHIQATDWTDFHADFATMNGRSYPDTLEPNGWRDAEGDLNAQVDPVLQSDGTFTFTRLKDDTAEARLASNPLSSLVQAKPGERILIRFANLGFYNRTFVFPGLEIDVLGRDARYVKSSAQRVATDSIQIGPGESRDVFFTAPAAERDYPFYDRGMANYPGNANGDDAWVGGARSAIRVIAGLKPQLKPNGWGGEPLWDGEQPLLANDTVNNPISPSLVASGVYKKTGGGRGRFLKGSVTVDPSATLSAVYWTPVTPDVLATSAPDTSSATWKSASFTAAAAPHNYKFKIKVANAGNDPSKNQHFYFVQAVDSLGQYSNPFQVQV